jgi:hypothetical protein
MESDEDLKLKSSQEVFYYYVREAAEDVPVVVETCRTEGVNDVIRSLC